MGVFVPRFLALEKITTNLELASCSRNVQKLPSGRLEEHLGAIRTKMWLSHDIEALLCSNALSV
jgi:hypothetical protein